MPPEGDSDGKKKKARSVLNLKNAGLLMTEIKRRARLSILHCITEFSLSHRYGDDPRTYGGLADYAFQGEDESHRAVPGDLLAIQSAPCSTSYLAWLIERCVPEGWSCERYTVENIEDGEIVHWHNIGITYLHRPTRMEHPEWRWTDRQHEFNDRWMQVCYRQRDAYLYLPVRAVFDLDTYSVTLGMRVRHNWDNARPTITFPDWRKTTKAMMLKFYDETVALLDKKKASHV